MGHDRLKLPRHNNTKIILFISITYRIKSRTRLHFHSTFVSNLKLLFVTVSEPSRRTKKISIVSLGQDVRTLNVEKKACPQFALITQDYFNDCPLS